jgi:hypothetical protein
MSEADAVSVVRRADWGPPLPIVTGGECWPVIWPGMGAGARSLHYFDLPAGGGIIPLTHPSEAVYYVVAGAVSVEDLSEGSEPHAVDAGGMFHIEPATKYAFRALNESTVVIGGPCPADAALYESQ